MSEQLTDSQFIASLVHTIPALQRGQVWCRKCGRTQSVNSAYALEHGWPKCCGETMTIDPPREAGRVLGLA